MQFTLSRSKSVGDVINCSYPKVAEITSKEELAKAVVTDHVCALYKGNYRSKENFILSNAVVMDCDNDELDEKDWITMTDLPDIFGFDIAFAAVASRNNMKQKGNKSPRPRFHIYFPIREIADADEYENLKKKIQQAYPFFDTNAMDSARFIFGVKDPEVYWQDSISTIDVQLSNRPVEILEGTRNSTLSKFAGRILKRYGICEEARKAFDEESNKCYPPLDFEELNKIWRSACRFYNRKVLNDPTYVSPEKYNSEHPQPQEQKKPNLPDPILLSSIIDPPAKPPELIKGILRQGHKMLIAGPSKAGKSFLLMELAIAIAQGESWMGFPCKQGKVLYINLEIDPASCIDRFLKIYERLGYEEKRADNILIWNLRGHALPLDKLAPILIDRMLQADIAAVIVDPIYKVITGDENNASEMGAFCNQFDTICTALNASVIYCHHHSKGAQGNKRAMDRASGSGVFARDPDALLDIIALRKPASDQELEEAKEIEDFDEDLQKTPWQMEASLREFPPIKPIKFFFDHPVHKKDTEGILKSYHADGSSAANLAASSKRTSKMQRKKRLDEAFDELSKSGTVTVKAIAEFLDLSKQTIRSYLKEFDDEYTSTNGVVQERQILDGFSKK